jgi:alkylhydroperoxidase family enzyme
MARLVMLRPEDFGRREWVALAWARDWTICRGAPSDRALVAEFESLYNEQERRDILAVVTAMDFSNLFMNSLTRRYRDAGAASCRLANQERPAIEGKE